jgi:hypothetical protein
MFPAIEFARIGPARECIPNCGELETSWGAGVQIEAVPVSDDTRTCEGKKAESLARPPESADAAEKGEPRGTEALEPEKDDCGVENDENFPRIRGERVIF